jgi:hypothetical protein
MADFVIARNPDPDSHLPYILCVPLAEGEVWLKAAETWPRASRVYCHPIAPVPSDELEIVERVPIQYCARYGPAIDLVLARGQQKRSQFVLAHRHGRALLFWQTAATAQQSRPGVRIPTGRLRGVEMIYIDSRERYGYRFAQQGIGTERRALAVGDYAAIRDEDVLAVVERKTRGDFATSLVDGTLMFRMAELAALPAAAVAVEASYAALLRDPYTRRGLIPTLVGRLAVRYARVPIVFLDSRKIAEEWTYRYLLAAYETENALPLS